MCDEHGLGLREVVPTLGERLNVLRPDARFGDPHVDDQNPAPVDDVGPEFTPSYSGLPNVLAVIPSSPWRCIQILSKSKFLRTDRLVGVPRPGLAERLVGWLPEREGVGERPPGGWPCVAELP
jgi:hypothetical protein